MPQAKAEFHVSDTEENYLPGKVQKYIQGLRRPEARAFPLVPHPAGPDLGLGSPLGY